MTSYVVYCHTNKTNKKKYIGITSQNPYKRWKNGEGYRNNQHFYAAIQKYGWHNFEHEILYTNLTKSEAEKYEVKLIKEYNCCDSQKGYNIEKGGSCGDKYTQETKDKISKSLRGKTKSEAHKKHLSESCKGREITKETREKISKKNSGINHPMYGKKRDISLFMTKKVKCLESGIVYESIATAGRTTGIQKSDISKNCNGRLKTAGGYHWQFVLEGGV